METNSKIETSFSSNSSPYSLHTSRFPNESEYIHENLQITKEMLKVLLSSHYFIKYQNNGHRSVKRVFFNASLQKLTLEKDKMNSKFIFTSDILTFENGFSDQLSSVLARNEFSHKVYGFKLVTRKRILELSCSSEEERKVWILCANQLVRIVGDWSSNNGLRKYWDTLALNSQYQKEINIMQTIVANMKIEMGKLQHEFGLNKNGIVEGVLSETILKVEMNNHKDDEMAVIDQIKLLDAGTIIFHKERSVLNNSLKRNDRNNSNQLIEREFYLLYGKLLNDHMKDVAIIWKNILDYMCFKDLLSIMKINHFFRNQVKKKLKVKLDWHKLASAGLEPRVISWKLISKYFYNMKPIKLGYNLHPEMIEEIQKDVYRGMLDKSSEIEEVLVALCALNPDIGYCQGMQIVTHFLIGLIHNSHEVLGILLMLIKPPFFLGELWKDGFPRLRLAIFQLEFLLKLKLPELLSHFENIDINLDVIIAPWMLTVFTHFITQQNAPIKIVQSIWDFFLIRGWPALIMFCLSLFHLSYDVVIGASLEDTLDFFTNSIPFDKITENLSRFEVDISLLDELEKLYYLKLKQ
ncbi:unnamed protein product [Blepharisma stoltei]|uniref:Rab-GAP TBC domain-containing protein n=1 Tax=Blepharisma stoltei TaxID=1481888 RepID=A0AAU9ISL5_9CILI|nr:unnamed protein product [Blepharisma stoltei]